MALKRLLKSAFVCFFCTVLIGACDSTGVSEKNSLGEPTLVFPLAGAETEDSVFLDWSDVTGASSYQVQVSSNSSFTTLVSDEFINEVSESVVQRLDRDHTYYWRVRALSQNADEGNWSRASSFKPVRQAIFPSYPDLVFPEDGSGNHDRSVLLRWDPVESAISYHLVVTIDEQMLLFQVDLYKVKDTSYLVEGLVLTYPYWWKVRTFNAAGYSEWSPVQIFQVKDEES